MRKVDSGPSRLAELLLGYAYLHPCSKLKLTCLQADSSAHELQPGPAAVHVPPGGAVRRGEGEDGQKSFLCDFCSRSIGSCCIHNFEGVCVGGLWDRFAPTLQSVFGLRWRHDELAKGTLLYGTRTLGRRAHGATLTI